MNHSVFKASTLFKISALSAALGVLAPLPALAATASNADVAKQLEILSKRVQELEKKLAEKNAPANAQSTAPIDQETDQRIRVLDRKLELANEDAAATKAAAAKAKSDSDKKAKLLPTVYGKINVAVEKRDLEGAENIVAGNAKGTPNNRTRLESFASRLGVKGEVDLDAGDLKAVYQLEYEVNVDDGANGDTAFSQRNSFAGLKSATYGQIIAGKIDTPFKSAEGKFDQFNDLRGDIDNLIGGQNRVPKIVIYSTPKFFDTVTANVAWIDAEGTDVDYDGHFDDGVGDSYSASIIAEQGIFYGALAYDKNVIARRSVDQTVSLNPATAPIGYAKGYTEAYRLVGGIKTGIWEGGVLLQRAEGLGPAGTATNNSKREDSSYLLSGAVNVLPKVKLKAQYGISNGDFSDEKGRLAAVGADYNFTPKTKVYSYYSTLNLDKADVTDKTIAVGLDHSF